MTACLGRLEGLLQPLIPVYKLGDFLRQAALRCVGHVARGAHRVLDGSDVL